MQGFEIEKLNFFRNGVVKLPPGFRFQPTDEELVFQYLKCKVYSCPLPPSVIREVNVFKFDPWDLPGDSEDERYFFSNREAKYPNSNRTNRATGSGYWKATGADKQIVSARMNQLIGMKKTLVFYRGKAPNGIRTDWFMHEYRLLHTECTASNSTQNNGPVQMQDWVICRIFRKNRNNNGMIKIDGNANLGLISSSSSSDSGSSVITEVSSTGLSGSDNEINEEV
ncbi:NAC domain [Dillenia turbinata]|uniref:NAC domain n=1 Tax=Dillenia turbinata TaxID=194707 RepID=A0AAN8URL5_9MAGN